MNNITYSITESDPESPGSEHKWQEIPLTNKRSIDKVDNTLTVSHQVLSDNERCAREIDYDLNYTFKYLTHILEFYGIKKSKLNKKEIIDKILEFEIDKVENFSIVEERKRLFDNFIELKNDKFFSKFIVGGF